MTADQAKQELAELEPVERAAWKEWDNAVAELEAIDKQWRIKMDALRDKWTPLYERQLQLKTFLEMQQ